MLGVSAENAETLNPGGTIALNTGTTILIGSGGTGGGLYNSTTNYSFNMTPDFVAKLAVEPGWGHWEVFGIGRSFRDRIYCDWLEARPTTRPGAAASAAASAARSLTRRLPSA